MARQHTSARNADHTGDIRMAFPWYDCADVASNVQVVGSCYRRPSIGPELSWSEVDLLRLRIAVHLPYARGISCLHLHCRSPRAWRLLVQCRQ